jgi:hypothetical protein
LEVVEVVAAEFLLLVVSPVLGEITVGDDGAQAQDGFGARGGPPLAGDVYLVLDQEPCRAFGDPGGDLPVVGQGGGVVQVGGLAGEVGDGFVGAGAFAAVEAAGMGPLVSPGNTPNMNEPGAPPQSPTT